MSETSKTRLSMSNKHKNKLRDTFPIHDSLPAAGRRGSSWVASASCAEGPRQMYIYIYIYIYTHTESFQYHYEIVSKGCQNHANIMSRSCHIHVKFMSSSCLIHVIIMSKSCQNHVNIMPTYCKYHDKFMSKAAERRSKYCNTIQELDINSIHNNKKNSIKHAECCQTY